MRIFSVLIISVFLSASPDKEWKKIHITGFAQGTTYSVIYYAKDSFVTKSQIEGLLTRINQSLSLYDQQSLINAFNRSDRGIEMDKYFKTVFRKSIEVNKETSGLFDITVLPLVEAWGFGIAKPRSMPNDTVLMELKKCVGSDLLKEVNNFLYKQKPCVRIDMNGIAQGYTVDLVAELLEKNKIKNYLVELGGEIRVKGSKKPSEERFTVGIESPQEDEFLISGLQKVLYASTGAITTSGSYRKFREANGKKMTHLINPISGKPMESELISVTVFAKDAITADAYDNAIMLMGLQKGLEFVEERKELSAYFIYKKQNGVIADTTSSDFYKFMIIKE